MQVDTSGSDDDPDMQVDTSGSTLGTTSPFAPNISLALILCGTLVVGIAWVWRRRKKNGHTHHSFKLGGLLLCILTLSMLSVSVATLKATDPKERAMIWGSESSGAVFDGGPDWSWRKHPNEIVKQDTTSAWIEAKFAEYDYTADDYQGDDGSDKTDILVKTSEADALYHQVAVVDFDHGNGLPDIPIAGVPSNEFHYMFEDQYGTLGGGWKGSGYGPYSTAEKAVYDFEVYPRTSENKVFFAFINTCNSANIDDLFGDPAVTSTQGIIPGTYRGRGMPFAWSHRLVENRDTYQGFNPAHHMSDNNGYARPDSGNFVYIGFNGGSAALDQTVDECSTVHDVWVRKFFVDAFGSDLSVKDALDSACRCYFSGRNFDQTPLGDEDGFMAVWPMYYADPPSYQNPYWHDTTGDGWMKVYGNGNIHLIRRGGAWHLDGNADDSAHGNDGSVNGGVTWTTGKLGSALSFNGMCGYMSVNSVSGLSGNMPHSIEAWVKVNSLPANRAWILLLGNEAAGAHHWLINSAGSTQFGVWGGGQTQPTLPVGQWAHIAMTFDGTTLKCYVNGALSDSEAATFNLAGTPLTLAKAHNGENYFNGVIDEVRIYDYVLSDSQIADNAAVASYHFNGGDYAYDSAPYGNTGTLYGATWGTGLRTSSDYSYGLSFDGSDDYVNVPSSNSLRITNAITIAAWIKISRKTGDSSDQIIVSKNGYDYILNVFGTGRGADVGKVEVGGSALSPQWLVGSTVVDDDNWHHIAFTYTGTYKMLYVDGNLDAYYATSGSFSSTTGALRIGRQPAGDRQVNGVIDEVRIYDRALSCSEIYSYYVANKPNYWLKVSSEASQYGGWIKIDGQYGSLISVVAGTPHTIEVTEYIYFPGYEVYFNFVYYTYDGVCDYDNPMTLSASKDTFVTANYELSPYPPNRSNIPK